MMNTRTALRLFLLLPGLGIALAQDLDLAKFQADVASTAAFAYGGDAEPLKRVEKLVFTLDPKAPQRPAVESALADALGKAGSKEAKIFLCKQLRVVGSDASIPALEKVLLDPETGHAARYALGRMEGAAAGEALHRAFRKAEGKARIGLLHTLSIRDHRAALEDIAGLGGDPALQAEVARALGRFGGAEALQVLSELEPAHADAAREINHALLRTADGFQADRATPIYQRFYAEGRGALRLAGLNGLVRVQPARAPDLLIGAIRGDDPELAASAVGLLATAGGADTTRRFAELLPTLKPDTQVPVLRALATRGDRSVSPAVVKLLDSPQADVALTAIEALGSVGGPDALAPLIGMAADQGGREQAAARASLVSIPGIDVSLAGVALRADAGPGQRAEAMRAMTARASDGGVPVMLLIAGADADARLRQEALRGLSRLAGAEDIDTLLTLAGKPVAEADRKPIESVIAAITRRMDDPSALSAKVLGGLPRATDATRPGYLRLLALVPSAEALAALRGGLASSHTPSRDAAIRTLADWPDLPAAEDLLAIARDATDETHKVLALRGYVRLADASPEPGPMFAQAMAVAKRPEEKKRVLGGLAGAGNPDALRLALKFVDTPELRQEAALAAIAVAERVRGADAELVREAVARVKAAVGDGDLARRGQEILNDIDKYEGFLMTWLVSGPWQIKGVQDGQTVHKKAFPPEQTDARVEWKPLTKGLQDWKVDLHFQLGNLDHVAGYLACTLTVPAATEARLEIGRDDAMKVWLNGKVVHDAWRSGGIAPRQETLPVRLNAGANRLLIKVTDHGGGWEACCRVRAADGSQLPGLKVSR